VSEANKKAFADLCNILHKFIHAARTQASASSIMSILAWIGCWAILQIYILQFAYTILSTFFHIIHRGRPLSTQTVFKTRADRRERSERRVVRRERRKKVTRADECNALHWLAAFSLGGTSERSHTWIIHALTMPARAFSSMSIRARPDRNDPGIFVSPQHAPANCPQIAPVVSASSPRLTARKTASSKESAS
jgi:hypothetical protein